MALQIFQADWDRALLNTSTGISPQQHCVQVHNYPLLHDDIGKPTRMNDLDSGNVWWDQPW